jgi:tRNA(Ile)-lysidine synthase
VDELIPAREDGQPQVRWPGAEVRRFRDEIFLMPALSPVPDIQDGSVVIGREPVCLGSGIGTLSLVEALGGGISPALAKKGLTIRFRRGGEELCLDKHARPLKKLLQEYGVLPWLRSRLPLLFLGNELVAVADLWIATKHFENPGLSVIWQGGPTVK